MEVADVLDIAWDAITTLLIIASPIMGVGLAVGLAIALFQSLTSIQEMTLTFVPKILAIFASLLVFMPFMITTMIDFMNRMMERVSSLQ